jgi:DNA polymerase I
VNWKVYMSKQKLLLIDGSNLLFRSYFAFARSNLTTQDGRPSGAVFGFIRLFMDAMTKEFPAEVFVAWDPKGGSFRDKEFEYYKANRPEEMPKDLRLQLFEVRDLLDYMGVKQQWVEGIEADDLIGTLAKQAEKDGWEALVYSGDRDLFQLVGDDIKQLYPSQKGGLELYDYKGVVSKMGVTPDQIISYKGLCGDASDNIKGVPGVGNVTAQKLLKQFGSFDEMYKRLDEVAPVGLQNKLRDNEQLARDSYYLATVKTDVEIALDLNNPLPFKLNSEKLDEFIEEYSLKTLQKSLPELMSKYGQKLELTDDVAIETKKNQNEIKLWDGEFEILKSITLVGLQDTEVGFVTGFQSKGVDYFGLIADLDEFLSYYSGDVILYDSKSFYKKYSYSNNIIDLSTGIYVWNSSLKNNVEQVCDSIGYTGYGEEYGGLKIIWLYNYLIGSLDKPRQDLWLRLESEVAKILSGIESTGVYIDKEKLTTLNNVLEQKKAEYISSIYKQLDRDDFNINSTQQLSVTLAEAGFKLGKKNKNGSYSTKADILEKLAIEDETGLIQKILEYRTVTKLRSTFTDTFLNQLDENSRLHTEYNQVAVPTGRLSSKNPNLQNIPIKHPEYGPLIRSCFAAPEGKVLISADYSQIELRCLAHVSKDEILIDTFKKNQDIHSRTAAEVFGVDLDNVDKNMRRLGKTLNFALVYQQGVFATSRQLGISTTEAKEFIEKYFSKFPLVKPLIEQTLETARELGYVETIWKRRRYFNNLQSGNAMMRAGEERAAFNAVLQGSGADIVKFAMLRIQKALATARLDVQLLLQVHDELVFEVAEKDVEQASKLIIEAMELNQPLLVPLKIDIGVGKNWNESK